MFLWTMVLPLKSIEKDTQAKPAVPTLSLASVLTLTIAIAAEGPRVH